MVTLGKKKNIDSKIQNFWKIYCLPYWGKTAKMCKKSYFIPNFDRFCIESVYCQRSVAKRCIQVLEHTNFTLNSLTVKTKLVVTCCNLFGFVATFTGSIHCADSDSQFPAFLSSCRHSSSASRIAFTKRNGRNATCRNLFVSVAALVFNLFVGFRQYFGLVACDFLPCDASCRQKWPHGLRHQFGS